VFFVSPYFDHDAFRHHTMYDVLDVPGMQYPLEYSTNKKPRLRETSALIRVEHLNNCKHLLDCDKNKLHPSHITDCKDG